jgi:N-acyl-D-amino-acid deacylase
MLLSPLIFSSLVAFGAGTSVNGPSFEATDCLDSQMIDVLDANDIPGANIAVLYRGEVAYEQGYGTRDAPGVDQRTEGRPALASTPFRIMSVSKSITSLTTLLIAQEGLLELDNVVFGPGGVLHSMLEEHEETLDPRISNITIRHLLQHTAGFVTLLDENDPTSDPLYSSRKITSELGIPGPASCNDTIHFMLDLPLAYTPGTQGDYSNFGYCVLGRVIEGATNTTYYSAVKNWLLEPSGVDLNEMYLGRVRWEEIPPEEAEYKPQGSKPLLIS